MRILPHVSGMGPPLFAVLLFCVAARGQTPKAWGVEYYFESRAPIRINDDDIATPYPSEILVEGATTRAVQVIITLRGFTHSYPRDVQVLLQGPAGQRVILMANDGGDDPVTAVTLTFSKGGAPVPGQDGPLVSGVFRPSANAAKSFPAPAPPEPYESRLDDFEGADPNGAWRLFVLDRFDEDSGTIAQGWAVTIIGPPPDPTACEAAATWFNRDSSTNLVWNGVAYGNGVYVAECTSNTFIGYFGVSPDGLSWTNLPFGIVATRGLIFARGVFVTTQMSGTVRWSTNGVDWLGIFLGSALLAGVAYDQGTFVAVTTNGASYFSTNLISWRAAPTGAVRSVLGVSGGGGRYVAVGSNGLVLVCTNRTNWQAAVPGLSTNLNAIVFGRDRFVAVGDGGMLVHSTDGFNWIAAQSGTTSKLTAVTYGFGRFVAMGSSDAESVVLVSETGWTWSRLPMPVRTVWKAVGVSSNSFFAVGSNGVRRQSIVVPTFGLKPKHATACARDAAAFSATVTCSCPPTVEWRHNGRVIPGAAATNFVIADAYPWHSGAYTIVARSGSNVVSATANLSVDLCTPLERWTVLTGPPANSMQSITCGDFGVVAAGAGGAIWHSPDGSDWTAVPLATNIGFTALAFGNGRYVGVASNGITATSVDGQTWTVGNCGTNRHLQAVAFGASKFLAVGDIGTVAISSDGLTWSLMPGLTTNRFLLGAEFGAGQFVVVGSNGRILTSPDGLNWTVRTSGTGVSLNTVAYGNGTYVAGGNGGTILRSSDGIAWSGAASGVSTRIEKLTFAAGMFAGLASEGVVTSRDGGTWVVLPLRGPTATHDIAYCGGAFYGIGGGKVLRTGYFGPPRLDMKRYGNRVQLTLEGEVSRIYRLQAGTDFEQGSWRNVLTFTNFDPVVLVLETNPPAGSRNFFRVVAE